MGALANPSGYDLALRPARRAGRSDGRGFWSLGAISALTACIFAFLHQSSTPDLLTIPQAFYLLLIVPSACVIQYVHGVRDGLRTLRTRGVALRSWPGVVIMIRRVERRYALQVPMLGAFAATNAFMVVLTA